MRSEDLLAKVAGLHVNVHRGRRAPHKPLLLLWALARFAQGEERLPFAHVESAVGALLDAFGPPHPTSPDYPFWHLQSDGVWIVEGAQALPAGKGQSKPLITTLREREAVGHLAPEVLAHLHTDPGLLDELVGLLLGYFPSTYHADLLAAVGLNADAVRYVSEVPSRYNPLARRPRDPEFRVRVLDAYEARCAVCGFTARLRESLVGIEAAHIQWHSEDGPDRTANGLALCVLHHRLFDRGAFTLSRDSHPRVVVTTRIHGSGSLKPLLIDLHGTPIRVPAQEEDGPGEPFIAWHHEAVFGPVD